MADDLDLNQGDDNSGSSDQGTETQDTTQDTSQATPPTFKGDDGSWRGLVGDDYLNDPVTKAFLEDENHKNLGIALKTGAHAFKKVGEKGIIPPKEGDPPEAFDAFWRGLGAPETPDGYNFDGLKVPENLGQLDGDFIKAWREAAHKMRIPQDIALEATNWYLEHSAKMMEGLAAQQDKAGKDADGLLQKEWGLDYAENLALADRAIGAFAHKDDVEPIKQALKEVPALKIPLNRLLLNIAKEVGEDDLKGGGKPSKAPVDELKARLAKLEEPNGPIFNSEHPQHDAAVAERSKIYKQLYPESKK